MKTHLALVLPAICPFADTGTYSSPYPPHQLLTHAGHFEVAAPQDLSVVAIPAIENSPLKSRSEVGPEWHKTRTMTIGVGHYLLNMGTEPKKSTATGNVLFEMVKEAFDYLCKEGSSGFDQCSPYKVPAPEFRQEGVLYKDKDGKKREGADIAFHMGRTYWPKATWCPKACKNNGYDGKDGDDLLATLRDKNSIESWWRPIGMASETVPKFDVNCFASTNELVHQSDGWCRDKMRNYADKCT